MGAGGLGDKEGDGGGSGRGWDAHLTLTLLEGKGDVDGRMCGVCPSKSNRILKLIHTRICWNGKCMMRALWNDVAIWNGE